MRIRSIFPKVSVLSFGLFAALSFITESRAVPIIAVDMQPSVPGIQDSRDVGGQDWFPVDIYLIGDGRTSFEMIAFDVVFNQTDADALELYFWNGEPLIVARELVETAIPAGTLDIGSGSGPVRFNDLITSMHPPTDGFDGNIGGIGLWALHPVGHIGSFGGTFASGEEVRISTLYFRLAEGAPPGDYEINPEFKYARYYDGLDYHKVDMDVKNGVAHVPEGGSTIVLLGSALAAIELGRRLAGCKTQME